jgi:hypothetical protein
MEAGKAGDKQTHWDQQDTETDEVGRGLQVLPGLEWMVRGE